MYIASLSVVSSLLLAATANAAPATNSPAKYNAAVGRGSSKAMTPQKASVLPPSSDPFYSAPRNFEAAAPGAILRLRVAPGNLTTVVHNSTAAYNILYRTTDSYYRPSWAVTTLYLPSSSSSDGKALVSYQQPYDSADVDASPSYAFYSSPPADLASALGMGWYVNVPDYEGPNASFTAGVQAGHATIDSVRAVLNSGFGLANDAKYAMWGYSGGALASEWAAELQVQYAPELDFAGAALGGLTPNISNVFNAVDGSIEAGLNVAGILGQASQDPGLMKELLASLNPTGKHNATTFLSAKNMTLEETIQNFAGQNITDYFINGAATLQDPRFMRPTQVDGQMGYHGVPQMPLYVYKSMHDEVSPVKDTTTLVDRYCDIGARIWYQINTIGGHEAEAINGRPTALSFLSGVLGGIYNRPGCLTETTNVNISSIVF